MPLRLRPACARMPRGPARGVPAPPIWGSRSAALGGRGGGGGSDVTRSLAQIVLSRWQPPLRPGGGASAGPGAGEPESAGGSASLGSTSRGPAGFLPGDASRMLLAASGRSVNSHLGCHRLFLGGIVRRGGDISSLPASFFLPPSSGDTGGGARVTDTYPERTVHGRTCLCRAAQASAGRRHVAMAAQGWSSRGSPMSVARMKEVIWGDVFTSQGFGAGRSPRGPPEPAG